MEAYLETSNIYTCLNDVGVYLWENHTNHLVNSLNEPHDITMDWSGEKYVIISLAWDYKTRIFWHKCTQICWEDLPQVSAPSSTQTRPLSIKGKFNQLQSKESTSSTTRWIPHPLQQSLQNDANHSEIFCLVFQSNISYNGLSTQVNYTKKINSNHYLA